MFRAACCATLPTDISAIKSHSCSIFTGTTVRNLQLHTLYRVLDAAVDVMSFIFVV